MIFSCKPINVDYQRVKGQWVIDYIEYENKPINNKILTNNINFKENNEIFIPITYLTSKKDNNQYWEFIKINNRKYLRINTTNIVFNGNYKMNFVRSKNYKGLLIELKSNSTYIKAHKLLSQY